MKKIKNNILKKEINKLNNYLYIFIIFIALGALFIAIGIFENRQNNENYLYLNDIIENKNNEENAYAYLEVAQAPYSIAKYENDENNAFYIVFDGRYFYIAYISNEVYERLDVEGLEENPLTIYGTTTNTPEELKQIALDAYNEGLEEEDQITKDDFNSYFGEIYLNNVSLKKLNSTFFIISLIPFILSLIFLILFITKKIKTKKTLNKLTEEELEKLESEIDDDRTKHYEKYHLILTENYIISFNQGLVLLKYNELIWIYEHRLKQYGITTAKNVFVMDNTGKRYNILTVDGINKKANQILKEVITIVSNKKEKILIGFNKKNEEEIKEILK